METTRRRLELMSRSFAKRSPRSMRLASSISSAGFRSWKRFARWELLERVGVDVALVVFEDLLLRGRLGQDPPDGYPMVTLGIIPTFGCRCN